MNIIVKGSHIEISEAIHDYVDKKVKSLEKFLSPDAVIEADMGKTTEHHRHGDIFRAELRIRNNGEETYVFVEKEDLYTAIDAVRLEAAEVLSSKKGKRKSLFKRGAQKIKSMFRSARG